MQDSNSKNYSSNGHYEANLRTGTARDKINKQSRVLILFNNHLVIEMSISPANFVDTDEDSVKLFASKLEPTFKKNLIRMNKAQVF